VGVDGEKTLEKQALGGSWWTSIDVLGRGTGAEIGTALARLSLLFGRLFYLVVG
jgi:hypothetical protein